MHLIHYWLFLFMTGFPSTYPWFYMHNGMPDCQPQGTPRFGQKWCNFTRKASELGAKCYFKCNEGYYLQGRAENQCVSFHNNRMAKFNYRSGSCIERPPNFPTGLSGPYKFSPHSAEDEYLSADENRRLVSTLVPQEHGQYFEVMEPGMISAPGSITFTSRRFLGNYLVVQGIRMVVLPHEAIVPSLGSFHDVSSFYLRQDRFIPGFAAFESSIEPGKFITVNNGSVTMDTPITMQQKSRASFTWST